MLPDCVDNVLAHGTPNPKTQLRSFVYHQLQVAYIAFVKNLGYEQMFIWACPPMAVRVHCASTTHQSNVPSCLAYPLITSVPYLPDPVPSFA